MFSEQQIESAFRGLNLGVGPVAGPPLLMLHGVLRQWSDFVPMLPALACRWHVHALDFRGHGRSGHMPGAYLVTDYVEDVLRVIATLDQPIVIYGHSLGAMVAAATAAAAPKQVRAIVLEDPPFETMGARQRESALQSLFAGYLDCLTHGDEIGSLTDRLTRIQLQSPGQRDAIQLGAIRDRAALRFAAAGLAKMDPDVLSPIVAGEWLRGYDVEAVARGIRCPTLVLQADPTTGGMLTDADVSRLEHAVADCSTIRFPGVGHLIHWSATAALLSATTAFLESLR